MKGLGTREARWHGLLTVIYSTARKNACAPRNRTSQGVRGTPKPQRRTA